MDTGVQGQEKHIPVQNKQESKFVFLLPYCSSDAQQIGGCPPVLVRVILFIQSTESHASLFQKHSNRHTLETISYQPSEHLQVQSSWHMKWTIIAINLWPSSWELGSCGPLIRITEVDWLSNYIKTSRHGLMELSNWKDQREKTTGGMSPGAQKAPPGSVVSPCICPLSVLAPFSQRHHPHGS